MALALTSSARVKNLLGISSSNQDTEIGYFVSGVSAKVARYIGTEVEELSRTEVYDADRLGQDVLSLKSAPIASITSIHDDPYTRAFAGTTLVDSDDYTYDSTTGIVYFDYPLAGGRQSVQVIYTAGLGTDLNDIIANGYEDLVSATEQQVIYEYKNRDNMDLASYTDAAGSVSPIAPLDWLPGVKAVMDLYRRYNGF